MFNPPKSTRARRTFLLPLAVVFVSLLAAGGPTAFGAGPRNATLLLIRHAEKPDDGPGLTPAGEARAKAYVGYFQNFKLGTDPVKLDAIFATADSKGSRRPRITVEPLAQAMGLTVNTSYKDRDYQALVNELQTHGEGKNILICWHHGVMPELVAALGADPGTLLPGGHWPGDEYGWVLVLRYDAEGKLQNAQRVVEKF